jgi:hypothetical protein
MIAVSKKKLTIMYRGEGRGGEILPNFHNIVALF